jgi:hypothetical protein
MPDYPKFEGWPDGENNILPGHELPLTTLRRSVNYDITDTGDLVTRRGRTKIYSGTPAPRTLYSNGKRVLFVEGGSLWELTEINGVWTRMLVRLNIGNHPMAYVSVNGDIYWSNGIHTGIMEADGSDRPWGITPPANQPTVLSGAAGGSLAAGRYQVAITFLSALGDESGTPLAAEVDVSAGGSIEIRDIPTPLDGSSINIYASSPGGEGLYKVANVLPGTPIFRIAAVSNAQGRRLSTQFRMKPPAGSLLEYYNGRIYIAQGNIVWITDPLRYGLVNAVSGFIMYSEDVTIMKAVDDGMYICADATYWVSGFDTDEFQQVGLLPYGGVLGTGINIPKSDNVAWFSKYGIVVAGLNAQLTNIQEDKSAIGEFENGAMIYREQGGLRQIIATLGTGTQSSYLAPDYVTLENARRGSAI